MERKKLCFSNFTSCNYLVRSLQKSCPQKHKRLPSKFAHNSPRPTVQQVFALWNWDSFIVWNLIFEFVKLCRKKRYTRDRTFRDISINSTTLSTFRTGVQTTKYVCGQRKSCRLGSWGRIYRGVHNSHRENIGESFPGF